MVEVHSKLNRRCRSEVEEPPLNSNAPIQRQPEEYETPSQAATKLGSTSAESSDSTAQPGDSTAEPGDLVGARAQPVEDSELVSWVQVAAAAAEEALGQRTDAFYVGGVLGITDWFVVTSGRNNRQVRAIVEAVEEALAKVDGPRPIRIEGLEAMSWVLMDYGFFVIHVFTEEARFHYDLERLWKDVPRLDLMA